MRFALSKFTKGHNSVKMYVKPQYMLCSHCLIKIYLCTKFCQRITNGLRLADLYMRIDARVVANNDDGSTDRQTDNRTDPYIAPCSRQARQKYSHLLLNVPSKTIP